MTITLYKVPNAKRRAAYENTSPYAGRYGFFATVEAVHSDSCTVDLITDTGDKVGNVRVASREWVTYSKGKKLTGERRLPPKGTTVYCAMCTGEYSSAVVIASVFIRGEPYHKDYKVKGAEGLNERRTNSGWYVKSDNATGELHIEREPDISIDIKDGLTIDAYGASIAIDSTGAIALNGRDAGGLIVYDNLKAELTKLSTRVKTLISAVKAGANAAASPSSTDAGETGLKAIGAAIASIDDSVEDFTKSAILSTTVLHGGANG